MHNVCGGLVPWWLSSSSTATPHPPHGNITILIFFFRGEDDNLDEDGDNIDNGNEDKLSQDGIDDGHDGHDGHNNGHHDGLQDTE